MSKSINQTSLGASFAIHGCPSSNEEFDQMLGSVGAACEYATDDIIKHTYLSKWRPAFSEALAKETGIAREVVSTKKNKDGSETKVYEKEAVHVARVLAQTGRTIESFNALAQSVADSLTFGDALVSNRGGGRVGKEFLGIADDIIENINAGNGSFEVFIEKMQTLLPNFVFACDDAGNPTRESIALAVKADLERQKAERVKAYT